MTNRFPPTPTQFAGNRRAAPAAAQRLNGPPELSPESKRLDQLARDQFEKQAKELSAPTLTRPALITAEEVVKLRAYRTGDGALDALVKITGKRLDWWTESRGGGAPFDEMSAESRALAEKFFAEHGTRLADQPRVAPPNPLKPKPNADQVTPAPLAGQVRVEQGKVELPRQRVTEMVSQADKDRNDAIMAAGAAAKSTPAPRTGAGEPAAAPVSTETKPAVVTPPAAGPDQSLVLLTRIARSAETQAAQIAALVAEIKALRVDLAKLPTAAPAAAEAFQDFVMTTLAVGFDDKSGEKTYKARGPQFKTFGVRVWPEVLEELGIDEDKLKMGENKLPKQIKVRAVLTADGKPRKVIGLAT